MPELRDFRAQIDAVDDRILALLGERFAVIREVAAFKAPRRLPTVIPERVEAVRERCAALAPSHGLEADFIRRLYALIIDEACRLEDRLMAGLGTPTRPDSAGPGQFR